MKKAEEAAEASTFDASKWPTEFKYYSSKYSPANNVTIAERRGCVLETIYNSSIMYKPLILNQDTHFYNISVNTSHSSVHVPINIFDQSKRKLHYYIFGNECRFLEVKFLRKIYALDFCVKFMRKIYA